MRKVSELDKWIEGQDYIYADHLCDESYSQYWWDEVEGELLLQAASSGDVEKLLTLAFQLFDHHFTARQTACLFYEALQLAALHGHAPAVNAMVTALHKVEHDKRDQVLRHLWAFSDDLSDQIKDEEDPPKTIKMQKWYFYGIRSLQSPLHLAVKEGHLSVVEELVRSFFLQECEIAPAKYEPEGWADLGRCWVQGVIEWAVRWGLRQILHLLLTRLPLMVMGGIKNIKLPNVMHLAAHYNHWEVLALLLQEDLSGIGGLLKTAEVGGLTALHVAATSASPQVVESLVETFGIDVNTRSFPEFFTALHIAADSGNLNVVRLLLQKSRINPPSSSSTSSVGPWHVDVLARDCMGRTALHYASRNGHEAVVQELLDCFEELKQHRSIARIADHDGLLALHMAARSGHARVIEKLITNDSSHAYINQQAKHSLRIKRWVEREYLGDMGLPTGYSYCDGHVHVQFQRPKLMDSLFFHTEGFTPLQFAARYGHTSIVEALKQSSCMTMNYPGVGLISNEEKLREMASLDLLDEKKAMEGLRRAWQRGCRPAITAAIVKWLEDGEIGRVRRYWLWRWAAQPVSGGEDEHLEMVRRLLAVLKEFEATASASENVVQLINARAGCLDLHRHVIIESIKATIWDSSSDVQKRSSMQDVIGELMLHLPEDCNLRAEVAFHALRDCVRLKKIPLAMAIVSRAPEVAMNKKVGDLLEDQLSIDDDMAELMVALVQMIHEDRSNILRELLEYSPVREYSKHPVQGKGLSRLKKVILERADVKNALYQERQVYIDGINVMLVGAALIAGVAFQGWLQPPLGFSYEYEGKRYAGVHGWYSRVFWGFNNMAFFLAASVFIFNITAWTVLSIMKEQTLLEMVAGVKSILFLSSFLLNLAMWCYMSAFGAAQLAVLPPDRLYLGSVSMVIGLLTILFMMFCFVFYVRCTRRFGLKKRNKLRRSLASSN